MNSANLILQSVKYNFPRVCCDLTSKKLLEYILPENNLFTPDEIVSLTTSFNSASTIKFHQLTQLIDKYLPSVEKEIDYNQVKLSEYVRMIHLEIQNTKIDFLQKKHILEILLDEICKPIFIRLNDYKKSKLRFGDILPTGDDDPESFHYRNILFYIEKSSNQNIVVYTLKDNIIHPRWINYVSSTETELNYLEKYTAYGISTDDEYWYIAGLPKFN